MRPYMSVNLSESGSQICRLLRFGESGSRRPDSLPKSRDHCSARNILTSLVQRASARNNVQNPPPCCSAFPKFDVEASDGAFHRQEITAN